MSRPPFSNILLLNRCVFIPGSAAEFNELMLGVRFENIPLLLSLPYICIVPSGDESLYVSSYADPVFFLTTLLLTYD